LIVSAKGREKLEKKSYSFGEYSGIEKTDSIGKYIEETRRPDHIEGYILGRRTGNERKMEHLHI